MTLLCRPSADVSVDGQRPYLPASTNPNQAMQALTADHAVLQQQLQTTQGDAEALHAAQTQAEQRLVSMQQCYSVQLQRVTSDLQSQLSAA